MKKLLIAIFAFLTILIVSCKSNKGSANGSFPESFTTMSDEERMAYMMRNAEPDSVARFLCYASLGRIEGIKIDTLTNAYLYALDNYRGADVDKFAVEYEMTMADLPLADKMRTQFNMNLADSLQIGYELGLSYVGNIRRKGLQASEIDKEIADFRKACGSDEMTFARFVKGFKVALSEDHGKDLSADIYKRYISMWPEYDNISE